MNQGLDADEMLVLLRQRCNRAGSQTRWAERHGIAQGYLSRVLRGERPFGAKILKALGYRKTEIYVPREE